jgi:hypothetical protein
MIVVIEPSNSKIYSNFYSLFPILCPQKQQTKEGVYLLHLTFIHRGGTTPLSNIFGLPIQFNYNKGKGTIRTEAT